MNYLKEEFQDDFNLEIIDVGKYPQYALDNAIFFTPTIVKLTPPPVQKVIGDLSNARSVVQQLGLGPDQKGHKIHGEK